MRRRKHLDRRKQHGRGNRLTGMAGGGKLQGLRLRWRRHALGHQQAKRAVIQHRCGGRITGGGFRGGQQRRPARPGAGADFNQRLAVAVRPGQCMRHRGGQCPEQRQPQGQPQHPGWPSIARRGGSERHGCAVAQGINLAFRELTWLACCRAWSGPWRQVCPCHPVPWQPRAASAPACSRHPWRP